VQACVVGCVTVLLAGLMACVSRGCLRRWFVAKEMIDFHYSTISGQEH
jgi:hypothetical protein